MGILATLKNYKKLKKEGKIKIVKNTEKVAQIRLEKSLSFTKKALLFILINAEMQMWFTYILAWTGRIEIAESLSISITQTIIGVVVGYLVKSLAENIAKYNTIAKKVQEIVKEQENSGNTGHESEVNMENEGSFIAEDIEVPEINVPIKVTKADITSTWPEAGNDDLDNAMG